MNEKEKREFYIAMCHCCLIAQSMKTCSLCRFNAGLAEKTKANEPEPSPIAVQIPIFALSELC